MVWYGRRLHRAGNTRRGYRYERNRWDIVRVKRHGIRKRNEILSMRKDRIFEPVFVENSGIRDNDLVSIHLNKDISTMLRRRAKIAAAQTVRR
jgi:hypothetical protein